MPKIIETVNPLGGRLNTKAFIGTKLQTSGMQGYGSAKEKTWVTLLMRRTQH
jgi:hypothetical protein